MSSVKRNRKGRDVFVMGLANVGKTAFIRALMKDMKNINSYNFDLQAFSNSRFLPIESKMPGTTLGMIKIDAFPDKKTLYGIFLISYLIFNIKLDTPGIHVSHRMTHLLAPDEMKLTQPSKTLRPYIPPTPLDLSLLRDHAATFSSETDYDIPEHITASYYWAGLVTYFKYYFYFFIIIYL